MPTDPAAWAATPYSPLAPQEIALDSNTGVLEFDGADGGLNASGDVSTGFTMLQPSSAVNPSAPGVLLDTQYYLPANLAVANGSLSITATKGIAFEKWATTTPGNTDWKNRQDNTLGVGLDPASAPVRLQTTFANPAGIYNSAQAGVWFGPDDDNFFKVVFSGQNGSASDTVRQFQLKREVAGATTATAANEINAVVTGQVAVGQAVTVMLDINPTTLKATGYYQIGTGAVVTIGTMDVPANFLDGSLIPASTPDMPGADTFGGIFATKRNMPEATPVTFNFSRFAASELDTVAPAAPGALAVEAGVSQNGLTWTAPADADVVGYRVYRSATANPVPADAANLLSGGTPLTATSLVDGDVFVGQTWNYSVYAIDGSGNVSPAASTTAVTPAPAGAMVGKYDFTTPAAAAAPGYIKEAGAPYSDATGFGWLAEDDRAPFDFALNTRVRAAASGVTDPRLLSLIHLQYGMTTNANPANGVTTESGVWERALPNGRYNVVVAAGDTSAGNFDSTHTVVIEGETAVEAFAPTASTPAFNQGIAEVTVTDGKLTIAANGGDNTKLSFVEIYELEVFGADAPTGLEAALAEDEESVSLTWQPVDGASGYSIYRSDVSPVDTSGAPLNGSPLSETSFTDDSLVPGATYYYAVVAHADGLPVSDASNEVKVDVPAEPVVPTAPTNVSATADADSIVVAWDAVPGATGYKVYRGANPAVEPTGTPSSGVSPLVALSFDDESAVAGMTYFYVVVAVGAGGVESDASAPVAAEIEQVLEPGECAASEWSVDYFGNKALEGSSIAAECLGELNEVLPQGTAPVAGVGAYNYSARYSKTIDEGAGSYVFTLQADDGARVFVDGELVLNGWAYSTATRSATVPLTAGAHEIVVEHFQAWGGAKVVFDYEKVVVGCDASQWSVDYFANKALEGTPSKSECVTDLDISLAQGASPTTGVGPYNYSARYTKTIDEGAGTYEFSLRADDGARVYVDGELLIDGWAYTTATRVRSVNLAAGPHVITVEYLQAWGGAKLVLDHERSATEPGECAASEWSVDYFGNKALEGSSIAAECLGELNEILPQGTAPVAGVGAYNYSARYSKTIDEGAGSYVFTLQADDGARVFVDGELVLNGWAYSTATRSATVPLTAGAHEIVVEHFQAWGGAKVVFDYEKVVVGCDASQWSVDYFANKALEGTPSKSECVTDLDISLAQGASPTTGVGPYNYSARYTKTIDEGAGTYEFSLRADDGARVYVDGELLIDGWAYTTATRVRSVNLAAGPHVITVEYLQAWGGAKLVLDHERTGQDTTPPAAPTQVAASNVGSLGIVVAWEASTSSDVKGYNVYRGTAAGVTAANGTKLNPQLLTGSNSFLDSTRQQDVRYYYVVTAVDQAGNESVVSNEASAIWAATPDTEAPEAPTALAAVPADSEVALTWTASASTDTVGYRVYRSEQPGALASANLISGQAAVVETTFTDEDVTNGTTYFYQVVAVDLAGNVSAASNEVMSVPRVPNTTDIKVDFTATSAVPAAGYVADWGQAYGARTSAGQGTGLTYGWVDEDGHALSLVTNGRDRNRVGVDERLDSILHMQYADVDGGQGTNGVKTPGIWELAVGDGLYEVTVAVGDQMGATTYDSLHTINVEGAYAIDKFQATASNEFLTYTATVGVWDGRLTLDALGGTNTKIAYVDVKGIAFDRPHIETVFPKNRALDADVNGGVAASIKVPFAGFGVNDQTMPGNVKVYRVSDNSLVEGSTNTSGGNDTVNFAPTVPFAPNTDYRFEVTDGVKDRAGNSWLPFTAVFRTGAGTVDPGSGEFDPLTNIAFEKVELPIGNGKYWASFAFGPDGKLYGSTIGQGLYRFTVNADGTLSNMENLGYAGIAIIGLLFDESSTAGNLKLWITNTSANIGNEQRQFISGISMLSGPNLENRKNVFSGMPRSLSDHLTNSMVYGPDGDIYVLQGSNQAAGDLDGSWGQRGEQLLTAALLHFDPDHARVQQSLNDAQGDNPLLVQTAPSLSAAENTENGYNAASPYNPYATDAPLKLYATGIRNAYDLVYHSNGHIYVPTNGTAGGANSPGVNYNSATNTWTRVAASGIPGFSTVNGQDVTAACQARDARDPSYTPRSVPAISNHPTQRDHLYDVVEGGYYGHPNPTRCEFVLHEGNDPANPPKWAGQGGTKYASGVHPESHYKGVAHDFEFNKSPNGAIEYKSSTFGGQLKGNLVVVRFSNNNDLIFLQADPTTGKILGAQTEVGITGVPNTTMQGVGGFNDPLEIVEDTSNGNLYVNQYDRAGSAQKLYLLRVPASQQAAKITSSANELVMSAVKSNGSATAAQKTDVESITVTNSSTETQSLSATIGGTNASEFTIVGAVPTSLAAGASTTFQVRFTPGTSVGQRSAQLTLAGGSSNVVVGLYGLSMNGIEGGNEPVFADVLGTLGYAVNPGWLTLAGGMQPTAKGDEVLEPLFVKSGTAPVTWKPLAHYAPNENIPFGWYTGDGAAADRHQVGGISSAGYQTLLPPTMSGSTPTFDPGSATFGFYYYSGVFQRYGFTEDRLNSPATDAHRARIYPAKNRSGVLIPNSYIVAFEDASNGDYQDYVFLVSGIKPVTDTGSGGDAIKVDFTTAAGDLAAGYIRDYGQAYGPRTGASQGSGLTYGWKAQTTEVDVDLSVGGSTPGNARDRQSSQTDIRLDSFMHMQPSDVAGTFNGTNVDAFWEIALPDGTYKVTVGVGDPNVGSDAESHTINAESTAVISGFVPSGVAGANGRHTIASKTVAVTDGALTLDAIGGTNTKIGFVDIEPIDVTDPGGDDPSDGAQVKLTFQPAGTPVPSGWGAETGLAFSNDRGYGWFDEATSQPVDRSAATRYRTAPMGGITFPTDPRQQGYAFIDNSTQPAYTSGYWEYALPNGEYEVAVSVGDANYTDSTHGVQVEGQPIIASFVPTTTTPFQLGVRDVTVTDGRLTITNSGDNTKINWISIKGEGLEPNQPPAAVQVNFRPTGTPVPTGWIADTGAAYSASSGYGWLVNGAPFDRSSMTRNRTAATAGITYPTGDVTRQSLILMQATTTTGGTIEGGTNGVWEYALANGSYTVSASVGDAGYLDSVHGVAAEGTPLITNYTPTGTAPFGSGTATVLVTDGKLTLTATGVNTKLNWVKIQGNALQNPSIALTANGSSLNSSYSGGTAVVTATAVTASGSTLQSLTYTVNGGASTPYNGAITLDTAGDYTVVFTATDSEGRVTTRTVEFEILNIGGTLTLANQQVVRQAQGGAPLPGLYEDVLVMHRVNSLGSNPAHQNLLFQDSATVTLGNSGTKDLRISALNLGGAQAAQFQLVNPPTLPLTLTPGQTVNLTAKFIATSGSKGVRTATLTVVSSDPMQSNKAIKLRGGYMGAPEGGSELTLQQIFTLFDSTTSSGSTGDSLGNGSENPGAPMDGDEVRSFQWKRLDSSKPVQAVQLGAFHGCCGQTETYNINGTSATHAGPYGQAIYPLKSDGTKTTITTNPGGNFGITVAGQSTTQTAYMAVKMWPVKDASGKAVPGAWFAGHDYISSPSQCGIGATNCDYQDNVYLITNILPVASSDTTAPAAPAAPTGTADTTGVNLSWAASTDADLIGYRVERASAAGGPWTSISGSAIVSGTTFRDAAGLAIATSYYRVVGVDASGNATPGATASVDTSSIKVTFNPIRINAGGPALTVGGVTWAADTYFTGGKSYTNNSITDVLGTTSDQLYRTERSATTSPGTFSYAIPLPQAGTYQVKLHFAEIYHGATGGGAGGAGKRIFSVNMEGGASEITNLDLNAMVAPMTAYVTTHTMTVTDGTLNIAFSSTVDQPKISAIEILPFESGGGPVGPAPVNTFTYAPIANQPVSVSEAQGEIVGGVLYQFGGFDSQKACCTPTSRSYSYNPTTNAWAQIAPLPFLAGSGAAGTGVTHAGITTDGEDIYLAGGYISANGSTGQTFGTVEVYKYDVSANSYQRLPNLPAVRASGSLEFLAGKLHYVTGTNLARTTEPTDHWTLDLASGATSWVTAAAIPAGRNHPGSAVLNGIMYVLGGQTGHDGPSVAHPTVYAYNPATNSWSTMAPMPAAVNHHTSSTFVLGNRIVVVGGKLNHDTDTATVQAFDPATNTWTTLTSLPAPRSSAVGGALGTGFLFTGGGVQGWRATPVS
ncbi:MULTISPECIES: PA14 domain-containing protein [Microbacterium]|uniref:PA14 domain-containing protein n=1 Tax=Microbacterium TaxID=33882 RepID=UPI0013A53255|nr:PA14 domain-containing protein [Microbacterium sp. KCTC 39802]